MRSFTTNEQEKVHKFITPAVCNYDIITAVKWQVKNMRLDNESMCPKYFKTTTTRSVSMLAT